MSEGEAVAMKRKTLLALRTIQPTALPSSCFASEDAGVGQVNRAVT